MPRTLLLLFIVTLVPAFGAKCGPTVRTNIACENGFAAEFPCRNVDLVAHFPLEIFNIADSGLETPQHHPPGTGSDDTAGNDIWGWTHPSTGIEYAIMGLTTGTAFVQISGTAKPRYLGFLPTHTGDRSKWGDYKVYSNHLYVVREQGGPEGLQVFDLMQLANVQNPPVVFRETAHVIGAEDEFEYAHNIVIDEESGYGYAVGEFVCLDYGGLYQIDLRSPRNPRLVGCTTDDSLYTHDAQCVTYRGPDNSYRGREICFAVDAATEDVDNVISILDVTNKSNTRVISRVGHDLDSPGFPFPDFFHQGWLTEDQRYFFYNDEGFFDQTETHVLDVSDLDNPVYVGVHNHATESIAHNLYIRGNYVYETNYTAGLRVLEILDASRAQLAERAFFDTHPENDDGEFEGAWSNYPFFGSGLVVVSDVERGLFVLRPRIGGVGNPDRTAPEIDIVVPGRIPILVRESPMAVELNVTDNRDAASALSVTWSRNNSTPRAMARSGSRFSASIDLSPGQNTLRFEARDRAGNTSHRSFSFSYSNIDTSKPNIRVRRPIRDGMETTESSFLIEAAITDDQTPTHRLDVRWKVNGGSFQPMTHSGVFRATVPLVQGDNNIRIRAEDEAGNVSRSNFTVERINPMSCSNATATLWAGAVALNAFGVTGTTSLSFGVFPVGNVSAAKWYPGRLVAPGHYDAVVPASDWGPGSYLVNVWLWGDDPIRCKQISFQK